MKDLFFIVLTVITGLLLALAGFPVDGAHRESLHWLTPAIKCFSSTGTYFLKNPRYFYYIAIGSIVLLLSLWIILLRAQWRSVLSKEPLNFVTLLLLSAILQLTSILSHHETHLWGILACGIIFLFCSRDHSSCSSLSLNNSAARDFFIPFSILMIASIYRLYALNIIHPNFEGELSPYYLGATTLRGIFFANEGIAGPWAPLGYLFYPPLYLTIKIFGSTTYAIRVASVLVSIVTYAFLYVVANRLFSKQTGIIALIFLTIDCLQIGWSRTDVHPHAVTTWMSVLILYTTYRAQRGAAWFTMAILFLLQILSWQQYPSGQTAALIPLFAFSFAALARNKDVDYAWRKTIITFAGLCCWFFVPILFRYLFVTGELSIAAYFERLGPRVGVINLHEQSATEAYWRAIQAPFIHLFEIIRALFFQAKQLFHQDIILPIPSFAIRTVNFAVAIGAFWGIVLSIKRSQRLEYLLLLAWILVALLPAIFSEAPYPKRCATLFPALMLAAGVAYADAFRVMSEHLKRRYDLPFKVFFFGGLIFASSVSSAQWFSEYSIASEFPLEEQIIRHVHQSLKPKTCIAILTTDNYAEGKFSYLLADSLSDPSLGVQGLSISTMRRLSEDFELNELLKDCSKTIQVPLPFYRLWGPTGKTQLSDISESYWKSLVVIIGPLFNKDKDRFLLSTQDTRLQVKNYFFYSTTDARQFLVLRKDLEAPNSAP